jgi:hypothetical protein
VKSANRQPDEFLFETKRFQPQQQHNNNNNNHNNHNKNNNNNNKYKMLKHVDGRKNSDRAIGRKNEHDNSATKTRKTHISVTSPLESQSSHPKQ